MGERPSPPLDERVKSDLALGELLDKNPDTDALTVGTVQANSQEALEGAEVEVMSDYQRLRSLQEQLLNKVKEADSNAAIAGVLFLPSMLAGPGVMFAVGGAAVIQLIERFKLASQANRLERQIVQSYPLDSAEDSRS